RQQDEIVLVLAKRREALGGERADHLARQVGDTQRLADWIFETEETLLHGVADDANTGGVVHVILVEHGAAGDLPALDVEVLSAFAAVLRAPVDVAVNDLRASIRLRRDGLDERDLLADGFGIRDEKTVGAVRASAHAVGCTAARLDPHKVLTEIRELLLDLNGAGLADGDDADDRADTDHDAEHGEGAAQLVAHEKARAFTQDGDEEH